MSYRSELMPLLKRQIVSWRLSDFVWVEVLLRLYERLPSSPTTFLVQAPSLFEGEGMIYHFDLIDPQNRLLVHEFIFQVFYHSDEQTLLVRRGIYIASTGS